MKNKQIISDNLKTLLDKAIVEPEFRWNLVKDKKTIINLYKIDDPTDLQVLDTILLNLTKFAKFKLVELGTISSSMVDPSDLTFRRRNINLTYQDALKYKKEHTM
jgi:hypothetical protein